MKRKLLTEAEVAARLRMSKGNLRALRDMGMIAFMPGRPIRYDENDVLVYIERARSEVAPGLRVGPPTAEEAAAAAEIAAEKAHAEMMRRIRMNHFRRQQAAIIKVRDARRGI